MEDKNLWTFSIKFTSKAVPRHERVKAIHDHHQIDLVDMNKMSVIYKGKTEKYIFSLLHVLPRFHWLLEIKHSSGVKRKLKKVYFVHGFPNRLHSDNGGEFKKHLWEFCTTNKLKIVRRWPYQRIRSKKAIMIWQGKESTELIEQSNYSIMLHA